MLIRIRNTAVMLFFELVVRQVRIGAAAQPELLDKLLALFVGGQLPERVALFGRNNVGNIFVQPLLVRGV